MVCGHLTLLHSEWPKLFGDLAVLSAIWLIKGDNFYDFLLPSLDNAALPKWNLLLKESASRGANSYLSELTPIGKGDKKENDKVTSLEDVPIHFKQFLHIFSSP